MLLDRVFGGMATNMEVLSDTSDEDAEDEAILQKAKATAALNKPTAIQLKGSSTSSKTKSTNSTSGRSGIASTSRSGRKILVSDLNAAAATLVPMRSRAPSGDIWDIHDPYSPSAHEGSSSKRKRIVKSAEAAAATPRRAQTVPYDEHGNPILPITFGVVTLHELGSIVTGRVSFHNKRYIWPVGYHTSRSYLSSANPDSQTVYHSRILDPLNDPDGVIDRASFNAVPASEGELTGPVFDVTAEDNPTQHFQSTTPTGAWTAVVKHANAVRGKDYTNSASGPDFFGLSNPTIMMLIEKLPGSGECSQYQMKVFETASKSTIVVGDRGAHSGLNSQIHSQTNEAPQSEQLPDMGDSKGDIRTQNAEIDDVFSLNIDNSHEKDDAIDLHENVSSFGDKPAVEIEEYELEL